MNRSLHHAPVAARLLLLALFVTSLAGALHAQDSIRIMSWNLLKYPGTTGEARNPAFRTVIQAAQPDLLVVQELFSEEGMNLFLAEAMGSDFAAGTFIDGPDTDNAVFYRRDAFEFLSHHAIPTSLRNIGTFTLIHRNSGDTVRIFSAHLKASTGSDNEQLRLAEVQTLRAVTAGLHRGANFIVAGDFNLYDGDEPAFVALLDSTSHGYFIDPINQIGDWHDNPAFAAYHTQSTRTTQFGGGATGGMDDRFDFMLISRAMMEPGGVDYAPGTYTAFGNDGQRFNSSVNAPPENAAVGQSVADALHAASDHLPVIATFLFGVPTGVAGMPTFAFATLAQNYPNPFFPATAIRFTLAEAAQVKLEVFDALGRRIALLADGHASPGTHERLFTTGTLPNGAYRYTLTFESQTAGAHTITKTMMLIR